MLPSLPRGDVTCAVVCLPALSCLARCACFVPAQMVRISCTAASFLGGPAHCCVACTGECSGCLGPPALTCSLGRGDALTCGVDVGAKAHLQLSPLLQVQGCANITGCCNVCRFECKSDGQYLGIEHVSLENSGEEPEDSDYTGPVRWGLQLPASAEVSSNIESPCLLA